MEVTLDKFGRIVIPKPVRDAFGLEAGAKLFLETTETEEGEQAVSLRPERERPALVWENGVLVHTGKPMGPIDTVEILRQIRLERARKHAGGLPIVDD